MISENQQSGLFIPVELLKCTYLNDSEQILLSFILKYSKNGICHMKRKELAEIMHKHYGSLRIKISDLRKRGFIKDIDNGLAVFNEGKHFILEENIYG